MPKPVIFTVDDDIEVLGAIERDLRKQYRADFRIVRSSSPKDALQTAREFKQRDTPVALFLVDQRMPEMTGTEFLAEAMILYPEASAVLLTAYADTEVAISCINELGIDHYLLKPWDPPEERLYPILDELLETWKSRARLPFDGIRVVGARWSAASYAMKEFLSRNLVPYHWVDIEQDTPVQELVRALAGDVNRVPLVFFPDGDFLITPTTQELAQKIGLQTEALHSFYDLIIIGAGPAGLAAAVYGASEGLKTLLIEQNAPGGQAGTSSRIENYLGFPSGLTGADLAHRATTQARRFGVELLGAQEVKSVRREDPYRVVQLASGAAISGYAVIVATGVAVRKLEAEGIENLQGIGVYYGAAMTEAFTYRDQNVSVVGGANSAGQGALFFSRYAKSVTMLVRSPLSKSMSQYLIDRIEATKNINVITGVEVKAVCGTNHLEKILLCHIADGSTQEIEAAAMFIFIGAAPRTELVADLLCIDEHGYVLTGPDIPRNEHGIPGWKLERDPFLYETNVPGIFAVGDVRAGSGKRVAAAVGEGSATVSMVHRYLESV